MERLKATKRSLTRLVADVMASNRVDYDQAPKVPQRGESTRFEKLRGSRTYFLYWPGHSAYFDAGFGYGYLSINAYGLGMDYHIPLAELRQRGMLEKVR